MKKENIIKFDPKLLGAVKEAMGKLPEIPSDLLKIKALTIFDKHNFDKEPLSTVPNWMELAPEHFLAVKEMRNLHTLQFKTHWVLRVKDFSFLSQLKKLRKLDLSGTNFSDCTLLKDLPSLQYLVLPNRRQLVHTEVLKELSARVETKAEKEERERLKGLYEEKIVENGNPLPSCDIIYTADQRLIGWIAASLKGLPETPAELMKIWRLDSLFIEAFLSPEFLFAIFSKKLPDWLVEKEGDFSLLAKLPNLRVLFLWGVHLKDFSFLAECHQLLYLNLWNTNFMDCNILGNLPNLQCVCLPSEQLKNPEVLTACRKMQEAKKKEELWAYLSGDSTKGAPDIRPLQILPKPKTCKKKPAIPITVKIFEGEEKHRDRQSKDSEQQHLRIVSGEEVIISCQGDSKVRHVMAQFYMDAKITPIWKAFLELSGEEDNWMRLPADKIQKMTDELICSIKKEDVEKLLLSLDPFGESSYLTLEFAQGWVSIDYMDDENNIYYSIYNSVYQNSLELCPVEVGGQSPVPKMLAIENLEQAAEIVRYFLEKGQLLPGTLWQTNKNSVI